MATVDNGKIELMGNKHTIGQNRWTTRTDAHTSFEKYQGL